MVGPWPRRLSAAVLTRAPSVLTPPGWVGCSAVVSFSSCWRRSSNSTGTAVRSTGITVCSAIAGPLVYAGVSWMARAGTSDGDRITALASAGTLYLASYQKLILTRAPCGSMRSILPTGTPRISTLSPTKTPLLLAKYPTTWCRSISLVDRSAVNNPAASVTASTVASPILSLRDFTGLPLLARVLESPRGAGTTPVTVSAVASTACPALPGQVVPAAGRRVAAREAEAGTDSSQSGRATASQADRTPD